MVMDLLLAGDVCPVDSNLDLFSSGACDELLGAELMRILENSSGMVCNLETAISDNPAPIVKSGPSLIAPCAVLEALKRMNIKAVSLANNHIRDSGPEGMVSTIQVLRERGFQFFGGGASLDEAKRPLVIKVGELDVGLYACAEHEFSIATDTMPGANPYDPLEAYRSVKELSKKADYTIVLYHGMAEYCRYPSPEVMRRCRAFIDAGASFVACQHSHCIGCHENYKGGEILYGQGDFCFTRGDGEAIRQTGLLANIDLKSNKVSYIPVVNDGRVVRLANADEATGIMAEFERRSVEICDDGFVVASWEEFCASRADEYAAQLLLALKPKWLWYIAKVYRRVFRGGLRFQEGTNVTHFLNMLQCEAHNELLRTALEKRMNDRC